MEGQQEQVVEQAEVVQLVLMALDLLGVQAVHQAAAAAVVARMEDLRPRGQQEVLRVPQEAMV